MHSPNHANQVTGALSREEVRRFQTLKYEEDLQRHNEKQKEKEMKKKAEKLKRYEHLFTGKKLSSDGATTPFTTIRENQQNRYQEDSVHNYIEKLERENERLRKAEQKRRELLLQRYEHVDTGCRLSVDETNLNGSPSHVHTQNSHDKEKAFREDMKRVREKMQTMYNHDAKKTD